MFSLVESPAAPRWVRLLLTSGAMAEAEGVASRVDGGDGAGEFMVVLDMYNQGENAYVKERR